MIFDKVTDEN